MVGILKLTMNRVPIATRRPWLLSIKLSELYKCLQSWYHLFYRHRRLWLGEKTVTLELHNPDFRDLGAITTPFTQGSSTAAPPGGRF